MPPLPTDLMAPMGAVIAALVLFAGLLHLGLVIVRRLKLPQDLPEGPHYEPPPPPVSEVLDPASAQSAAARAPPIQEPPTRISSAMPR